MILKGISLTAADSYTVSPACTLVDFFLFVEVRA